MFLSLEIRYTLNYLPESTATFSKLSIYGQGQGHRNNKSAKKVSFFLIFMIMCSHLFVIVSFCLQKVGGVLLLSRPSVCSSVSHAF